MDVWSNDQLEVMYVIVSEINTNRGLQFMRSMGNTKANTIYNPNELRHPPPPNLEDTDRDSEIEQYIRCKRLSTNLF